LLQAVTSRFILVKLATQTAVERHDAAVRMAGRAGQDRERRIVIADLAVHVSRVDDSSVRLDRRAPFPADADRDARPGGDIALIRRVDDDLRGDEFGIPSRLRRQAAHRVYGVFPRDRVDPMAVHANTDRNRTVYDSNRRMLADQLG